MSLVPKKEPECPPYHGTYADTKMDDDDKMSKENLEMDNQRLMGPIPLTIKIICNNVVTYLVPVVRNDMEFKELRELIDHHIMACFVGCCVDPGARLQDIKRSSIVSVIIGGQEIIPLEELESNRDLWKSVVDAALANLVGRVARDVERKEGEMTEKKETNNEE